MIIEESVEKIEKKAEKQYYAKTMLHHNDHVLWGLLIEVGVGLALKFICTHHYTTQGNSDN